MLVQLIYASMAVRPLPDDDLVHLLRKSRDRNRERNITGMLIYHNSVFLQVLEGEEEEIGAAWDVITADPRHDNLVVIRRVALEEREFPNWSMGFCHATRMDLSTLPGYNGWFGEDFSPNALAVKAGQARMFLLAMKEVEWPETPAGRHDNDD